MRRACLLATALLLATLCPAVGVTSAAPAATAPERDADAVQDGNATAPSTAAILEHYPNPVADGNRGEYLVVDLPRPGNWSLWDGHHRARLPEHAVGAVVVAMDPEYASRHVDGRIYRVDHFPLSASGDRIELRYEGTPVDVVEYADAEEATVWRRGSGWRPYGYEAFDPGTRNVVRNATATAFVLPDEPNAPLAPLREADDRIRLAGYTLASERVADALVDAHQRGVVVSVLVEGTPVGGFPRPMARVLDRLHRAGIEVRVLAGPRSRFAFHHAKYAVADDRVVVMTENWKPAGTGGAGSRGWGVTVANASLASDLARLFELDATAVDAQPWPTARANVTLQNDSRAAAGFPDRFGPLSAEPERVELLVTPEGGRSRMISIVDDADERVFVVVPRAGDDSELLAAVLRAADRGVRTRILLSNAWYDERENENLTAKLNARAVARDVPLTVSIAEPRSRYGKVHAKGVVADDTVVVGSLNWNRQAATENREVLLAIESPRLADYFARVFAADWRGGSVFLPFTLVGAVAAALLGAGWLGRRKVSFVR
ncbi:phospholipase D-like domain-containing protein [Haloparvum sp. PAK95]|uniref:phospholipase D-like domain-containing protein n=1 Tax=Haloparvum sp. PAK95 TaxID=3418962 RepID=UPI003D2EECB6